MKTPITHDQIIKLFDNQQAASIEIIRAMQTAVNATTRGADCYKTIDYI